MNIQTTKELFELANEKYGSDMMYSALWGCATALLTDEQAETIKAVIGR
jgi:hypothetical protein